MDKELKKRIEVFKRKFENSSFEGYSVYDAFNSPLLRPLLKLNFKLLNVSITQFYKRVPFNIRTITFVKKSINPKSLGLILKARLYESKTENDVREIYDLILSHSNKAFDNLCWGYNWDYFTLRGGTFPKDYPNAIVTYFIGDALLDYYIKYPSKKLKTELFSIKDYFEQDLYKTIRNEGLCFSYSSMDSKEIYNASALVSKYLYRLEQLFEEYQFKDLEKSILYLISNQNSDGSWYYGYSTNQKWIDSFHTEYMLEFFDALNKEDVSRYDIGKQIDRASKFYLNRFYKEGKCNYFPDKTYPINVHSLANRVIYLSNHNFLDEAKEILHWAFNFLYDSKRGNFFFEKRRYYINRNVYHRWNQSWMYLAIATFLFKYNDN